MAENQSWGPPAAGSCAIVGAGEIPTDTSQQTSTMVEKQQSPEDEATKKRPYVAPRVESVRLSDEAAEALT